MAAHIEIPVKTWEELRQHLGDIGHDALWYFRGHTNSAWNLQPKLERAIITYKEKELYEEFKRTAHLYTNNTFKVESKMEWLSLMSIMVPPRA